MNFQRKSNNWRGGGKKSNRGHGGRFGNNNRYGRQGGSDDIEMDSDGEPKMRDLTKQSNQPYSKNRPRHNGRGGSDHTKAVTIVVKNIKDGPTSDIIKFLESSAKSKIEVVSFIKEGRDLLITVPNKYQAKSLKDLSGLSFEGSKLYITYKNEKENVDDKAKLQKIEAFKTYLRQQYDEASQALNLKNMANNPRFVQSKFKPLYNIKSGSAYITTFYKIARDIGISPISIDFSRNRLSNLDFTSKLGEFFPELKKLTFNSNNLTHYNALEGLEKAKNIQLEELEFLDNPFRDKDIERNQKMDANYRSRIAQKFPNLRILDGTPLKAAVKFGIGNITPVSSTTELPIQPEHVYFSDDNTMNVANDFIGQFFNNYDSNRDTLVTYYDSSALFSINIMSSGDSRKSSLFKGYSDFDHNLKKYNGTPYQFNRQYFGNEDIVKILKKLPGTKHPIDNLNKFSVEAQLINGMVHLNSPEPAPIISVVIHGEFLDVVARKSLSFDRSFMLGVAQAGTPAHLAGLPCNVLSDSLTVRDYSRNPPWLAKKTESTQIQQSMQPNTIHTQNGLQQQTQIPIHQSLQQPNPIYNQGPPQQQIQEAPQQFQSILPTLTNNQAQPEPQPISQMMSMTQQQPATLVNQAPLHPELTGNYSPQQKEVLIALMKQTRLKEDVAAQCLQEYNWDLTTSVNCVNTLKAQGGLPPESFF